VTWADYRNGDLDVLLATSEDQGAHWSQPIRVNTDRVNNGADQFFPWLAVDRVDSSVSIVFYDRRTDPNNRQCNVTLARSTNGGRYFKNYRLTHNSFDPQDEFLGDYLGIAARAGRVYCAWTRVATPEEKQQASDGEPQSKVNVMLDVSVADFQTQP
jgi:hypothetical protein